jgi:hypothetical protein
MLGNLTVRPITCKLELEDSVTSSLHPFIKAVVGYSSKTIHETINQEGVISWNEELKFNPQQTGTINIQLWNKGESGSETLIGNGEYGFDLMNIKQHIVNEWIDLKNLSGKNIGKILTEIDFSPSNSDVDVDSIPEGIPANRLPQETSNSLKDTLGRFLRNEKPQNKNQEQSYFFTLGV